MPLADNPGRRQGCKRAGGTGGRPREGDGDAEVPGPGDPEKAEVTSIRNQKDK